MEVKSPRWSDYELLDAGNGEKLERYGQVVVARPEPQALWRPRLTYEQWQAKTHVHFVRDNKTPYRLTADVRGAWVKNRKVPDYWPVTYRCGGRDICLLAGLTAYGHVGMFPEQGVNWNFIDEQLKGKQGAKILNLFAYTGAASVVASVAGADVTHVDASRPGINWANKNREINNVPDIRWVHEDVMKFVNREVKRGRKYDGIIMDPPLMGRGPKNEKWLLYDHLEALVALCPRLMNPSAFLTLSTYAAGISSQVPNQLVSMYFPDACVSYGELCLPLTSGGCLPAGNFLQLTT